MSNPITTDNIQTHLYHALVNQLNPNDTLAIIPDAYPTRVAFSGNVQNDFVGTAHFYIAHRHEGAVTYQMGALSYFVQNGDELVMRDLNPVHPLNLTHLINLPPRETIGRTGLQQHELSPIEAKLAVDAQAASFRSLTVFVGTDTSDTSTSSAPQTSLELKSNGILLGRVLFTTLFNH